MCSFFRDLYASTARPIPLVILAISVLINVVAGPFGTYTELGLLERLIYWSVLMVLFHLLTATMWFFVRSIFPYRKKHRDVGVSSFATAVTFVFLVIVFSDLFFPGLTAQFPNIALLGMIAFLVALPINLLTWSQAEQGAPTGEMRILRRLPEELRGELLRLSVDDHYVLVFTAAGMHRVLMRLGDAILEAQGADGFCVHRSHWVARSAVVSAEKAKGRMTVTLTDGTVVPVSRTYHHRIEEGGWL